MIKKIFRFLTWVFGVVLLVSCSSSMPDEPQGMEFQMLLRMPKGAQQTRADYNTDYYNGQGIVDGEYEGLDYTLVGGDVSILFYNKTTGEFVEEAQIASMEMEPSQTTFVDYRIRGRLTNILANDPNEYRIVALANLNGQLPTVNHQSVRNTEESLCAGLTFDYQGTNVAYDFTQNNWESSQQGSVLPETGRVPMWGKATAQLSSTLPVQITMLRALAKVRVELSDQMKTDGFIISDVQLHGPNNSGFVAPTGAVDAANTASCSVSDAAINVPVNAIPLTVNQQFYQGKHSLAGKWYTYLPETQNTGTHAGRCYMTVSLKSIQSGIQYQDMQFRLEFGDYQSFDEGATHYAGSLFDVQRNHYYQYVIDGIQGNNLIIKYVVCAWQEKTAGSITFN